MEGLTKTAKCVKTDGITAKLRTEYLHNLSCGRYP